MSFKDTHQENLGESDFFSCNFLKIMARKKFLLGEDIFVNHARFMEGIFFA